MSLSDMHAKEDEKALRYISFPTNKFEAAIVFLHNVTETFMEAVFKHKSLRMELYYNAEAKVIETHWFIPDQQDAQDNQPED